MRKGTSAFRVDEGEVLRYLGYGGAGPDAKTRALIGASAAALEEACTPRWVMELFVLPPPPAPAAGPPPVEAGVPLAGTRFLLPGRDICRHLAGCRRCALLAATLGAEADRLIAKAQVRDMARALVLDSCATAAIEDVCDRVQAALAREMAEEGLPITGRFSPGYGDMPLDCQRGFVALLDTARQIGLAASASHILTPRKSVTAVIGIGAPGGGGRGCGNCALRESCAFKRRGGHCGKKQAD